MTSNQAELQSNVFASSVDADSTSALKFVWRARLRRTWDAFVGGIGLVMGLVPHVLHHVGFLAGTVLIAGSGGTALFGAVGFVASIPFLLRLRRRFGTWRAPAIGLLIFTVMFSISAFVIGPAISGAGGRDATSVPGMDHNSHHSAHH